VPRGEIYTVLRTRTVILKLSWQKAILDRQNTRMSKLGLDSHSYVSHETMVMRWGLWDGVHPHILNITLS
jgi:hypothetical protein